MGFLGTPIAPLWQINESKEDIMDGLLLQKKIAGLEFVNDQLGMELQEIDRLLKATGFPEGIASAKSIAQELIAEGLDPIDC